MKDTSQLINGPVVIGGVGGSGTRVITQILIRLGYFMGRDLNYANDNLLFTLLFKRPKWGCRNLNENEKKIFRALAIFEKCMLGGSRFQSDELRFIMCAVFDIGMRGNNHICANRGLWPVYRMVKMFGTKKIDLDSYTGWGWKEPNSHIYIEHLSKYFTNLKYIHTIRHGLDMSYSNNQQQLYNWGKLFGIQVPSKPELITQASLHYWIKANERVLEYGKQLLGDRMLILNFDKLCYEPRKNVGRLIDFLEIDKSNIDFDNLCRLIKMPKSIGRHRKHEMNMFSKEEIDSVKQFGFEVH